MTGMSSGRRGSVNRTVGGQESLVRGEGKSVQGDEAETNFHF